MMPWLIILLSQLLLCVAEDYKAWYLPEDKLANYPDHPHFKKNIDIWTGFTLKEKLFPDAEMEEVSKIAKLSCG